MHEEIAVETSQLFKGLTPGQHGGATGPEYGGHVVVLANIGFHAFEHTAAAKRVSQQVYEAAAGAGIFKIFPVVVREDAGLHKCHGWILLHHLRQGLQASRC